MKYNLNTIVTTNNLKEYISGDTVNIKINVKTLRNFAFYGRSYLKNITLGEKLESIGSGAFAYCTNLKSITIPDTVTTIGQYAFKNCMSLTTIYLPTKISEIPAELFYNCEDLISVTIPNNVRNIGNYAFAFCDSLETIYFSGSKASWNNINKVDTWNYSSGITSIKCTDGWIYL